MCVFTASEGQVETDRGSELPFSFFLLFFPRLSCMHSNVSQSVLFHDLVFFFFYSCPGGTCVTPGPFKLSSGQVVEPIGRVKEMMCTRQHCNLKGVRRGTWLYVTSRSFRTIPFHVHIWYSLFRGVAICCTHLDVIIRT